MHPASLLYCTGGYIRATGKCVLRGGGESEERERGQTSSVRGNN